MIMFNLEHSVYIKQEKKTPEPAAVLDFTSQQVETSLVCKTL
jgi:hypothetical protein